MSQLTLYAGKSNLALSRSQSDSLIVGMAMAQDFIAAAWRGGEPIIFGFGKSAWAAMNMARLSEAPPETELCTRIPGELSVWQGPSGRRVTVEHLLTLDD